MTSQLAVHPELVVPGFETVAGAHQGLSEARVDRSDSFKEAVTQLGETDRRGPRPSPNVDLTVF
jgi:hypothetical protein